ncbi:hypothetical protein WN48_07793 [Eufriesea mexicana]|uniref:Spermatogenesis-associated protein 7 like protein n=1 Tax=Eufriesea mexicana TaxID=516756 RepID=A0A310SLJ5_9HYME|nr:hypothetical protein WN48_07793 [Eufriesea mexicana]
MTRCTKSEVNLKSTAYNQNGQNYFEQLTAYNSMSAHLRRILLAKCVVDARNKTYMRKKKQICKEIVWKPRFAKTEITNNIIDKLAYDTSYHPVDFLKMNCDLNYFCQCETHKLFTTCYNYDVICSRPKLHDHVVCPNFPMSKTNDSEQAILNSKDIEQQSDTQSIANHKKLFNPSSVKTTFKIQNRHEGNSIFYESGSDFLSQNNQLSSEVSTSRSSRNYETTQGRSNLVDNQKLHIIDEEAKYAKFMYEITHEIVLNGLYTDEELQEVFKKHIEKNKTVLDMNRMMYEIYQLKLTLNITNNSEDEELEDLVYIQQLRISNFRPPTPPKVLNEDKITEKLSSYKKLDEIKRDSLRKNHKSVVLIDANPELRVTERDVLTSLIEADINPEQAEKIYRKLSYRSKDIISLVYGISDEYEAKENDRLNFNSTESYNVHKADERKVSSITDNAQV